VGGQHQGEGSVVGGPTQSEGTTHAAPENSEHAKTMARLHGRGPRQGSIFRNAIPSFGPDFSNKDFGIDNI
jgi:hypothetical protein